MSCIKGFFVWNTSENKKIKHKNKNKTADEDGEKINSLKQTKMEIKNKRNWTLKSLFSFIFKIKNNEIKNSEKLEYKTISHVSLDKNDKSGDDEESFLNYFPSTTQNNYVEKQKSDVKNSDNPETISSKKNN